MSLSVDSYEDSPRPVCRCRFRTFRTCAHRLGAAISANLKLPDVKILVGHLLLYAYKRTCMILGVLAAGTSLQLFAIQLMPQTVVLTFIYRHMV